MFFLIGKILLRLKLLCNPQNMNPIVSTLIKGMLYLILKAKQGGKYLNRKQVVDRKTGKMRYQYKYKPMQQRAAHEVTRGKFEKVTKLSGDEHKNQIEHALQNGIHVSLHVLRDYPDLAVKYHQQARLAKADKIRAKVKTHKENETEKWSREKKRKYPKDTVPCHVGIPHPCMTNTVFHLGNHSLHVTGTRIELVPTGYEQYGDNDSRLWSYDNKW